jgi:hypothetical protein
MVANRLVELVEAHADQIKARILAKVRADPRLREFKKLPESELLQRFGDVCVNFGRWLEENDDHLFRVRYQVLGRERFDEGIPLQEVVLAAMVFKQTLLEFCRSQAVDQTALEMYNHGELEQLISGFFDRLIYHLVVGYEECLREASVGLAAAQGA